MRLYRYLGHPLPTHQMLAIHDRACIHKAYNSHGILLLKDEQRQNGSAFFS